VVEGYLQMQTACVVVSYRYAVPDLQPVADAGKNWRVGTPQKKKFAYPKL
jgi:hypothetical protein